MPENIAEPLLNGTIKTKGSCPGEIKTMLLYLVSEIMLQQTRVEAVKPYFQRFIQELPDVAALAAAPEERIIKLWEALAITAVSATCRKRLFRSWKNMEAGS